MPTYRCPIAGCANARHPDHLMCRSHWRQVPRPVQKSVWYWWKRVVSPDLTVAERLTASRQHDEAKAQAIAAVEARAA